MDGCRARRLNCGSPFGRIIDEAGDTVVMANYSLLLAYALGYKNCYLELMFFFMNFAFYCMEVKHKVTGSLVMAVGEISSVEVELLIASLLIYFGYYGNELMQKSFGEHFGIEKDSTFYAISDYRFSSATVGSILILL
jgi:phosphatidylglycerophosphate synthase